MSDENIEAASVSQVPETEAPARIPGKTRLITADEFNTQKTPYKILKTVKQPDPVAPLVNATMPTEAPIQTDEETAAQTETKPEDKPTEQPKEGNSADELSERLQRGFVQLTRKEKELNRRTAEIKAQEKEIAELRQRHSELLNKIEAVKADPLKFQELGFDYDAYTKALLGHTPAPKNEFDENHPLVKKISDLDNKLSAKETEELEAKVEAARQNVLAGLNETVKDAKYEFCQQLGKEAIDLAYDVMENVYKDSGKIISYDEALSAVEEVLDQRATRFANTNKFKTRFTQAEKPIESNPQQPSTSPKATTGTTTTNLMTTAAPHGRDRKLTREESLKHAASLIKFT